MNDTTIELKHNANEKTWVNHRTDLGLSQNCHKLTYGEAFNTLWEGKMEKEIKKTFLSISN